jgi:hypothetical protein
VTGLGPGRLCSPCSEQGKLSAAEEFKLAERDKTMSEQKLSYLQELDLWTEENLLRPLFGSDPNQNDWANVEAQVKRAIRQKVLKSYHNGQAAGPRPVQPAGREPRYAQAKTR